MLHVLVLIGAVVAALVSLVFTFFRIERARERGLRRLATSRGWRLPDSIDGDDTTIAAPCFGVDVSLLIGSHRVVAHSKFEGEKAMIRRLAGTAGLGSFPGLEPAATEDTAFDSECELLSVNGAPPAWLTTELRRALLSVEERWTATSDGRSLRIEIARTTMAPALLERLAEIVAAAHDPAEARRASDRLGTPVRAHRTIPEVALRAQLVLLPVALAGLYFALRPSEVGELRLGTPGEIREASLKVREGDVVEVWQDVRFDAARHPSPGLGLDIEARVGAQEQRLRCNPFSVNSCTTKVRLGGSLERGLDCHLEECDAIRADRSGTLLVRVRLTGDDPQKPYATDHVVRFKRRSRLFSWP